jgi:hypothetical protein
MPCATQKVSGGTRKMHQRYRDLVKEYSGVVGVRTALYVGDYDDVLEYLLKI